MAGKGPPSLVRRVAAVLRELGKAGAGGATTSTLAEAVGLPRPTVHRVLMSLLDEGFVDRDRRSGGWFLGPELYLLGSVAARRFDVVEVALPFVRRLAEATGESAFFSARRGDETVCLVREDGSFPLRSYVLDEGSRFPLGVVSAGLVVLAHLPDVEIDRYLTDVDLSERWGVQHATESLRERIAQTRRDGYATNPGLVQQGSWGMAAAVFDWADRPQWTLTLTGVEARFGDERRPELGRLLLESAHALGARLRVAGARPLPG